MAERIVITEEEYARIIEMQSKYTDDYTDQKLRVLLMNYQGSDYEQIANETKYSKRYVPILIHLYKEIGLAEYIRRRPTGHCWNMPYKEEQRILDQCAKEAEDGKNITVADLRKKLESFLGRETAPNYVYGVLKRHGWRKVIRRSEQGVEDISKKFTRRIGCFAYRDKSDQ